MFALLYPCSTNKSPISGGVIVPLVAVTTILAHVGPHPLVPIVCEYLLIDVYGWEAHLESIWE